MSQIKVNIGGSAHDPYHRYWRSRLQVSQRKGSTVIENLASLAREVKSPPDYILQFFKNSLGVPTSLSKSPPYSGSLKGVHQASVLEKLLESYIKLFVLCRKCDKPELSLGLSKDRRLQLSCSSCGHVATLREGDHKVVKFVIADLQSKKPKRNNTRYYSNAHGVPAKPFSLVPCEIDDSEIPSSCSGVDEGNEDGKDDPDDDDDDDWSSDTPSQDSEVKDEPSEQKASSPPMSQPPLADPPTSLLVALQHMNLLQAPQELIKSIATACEPIEGETVKATELVRRVKREFSSRAPELITWIRRRSGSPIAQAERLLLSALQFVLAEDFPRLGPTLPHILLVLYEKEVVTEETILGWYHTNDDVASPSSQQLRQACGEFVRWLETAEEEEDDE